jgi:iron complex outermembrane recepter protein
VQAATVQGSTSGNAALVNEIAEQWSVGFVYQPSQIPGLTITADWIHVDLTNAIFNFNLTSIMQVCYDSPNPPLATCGLFQRGTSTSARPGQVLGFGEAVGNGTTATGPRTGFVNAGYINFEGLTAGIDYSIDLETWLGLGEILPENPGELDFNFDLFHVKRQQTSVTGLGFDLNRDHGEIGNAKWQAKLETAYTRDPLSVIWTVNYTGASSFNNDFTIETRYPLKVADYFIHDVAFSYDLSGLTEKAGVGIDEAQLRFIVRNLGNTEAPFGTTGLGVYDPIGRYYQVGLTARF